MSKTDVKVVKTKSRFVLTLNGKELAYDTPKFNKKMEWKNYCSAKWFLKDNEFYLNGELINKDNIVIKELREQA